MKNALKEVMMKIGNKLGRSAKGVADEGMDAVKSLKLRAKPKEGVKLTGKFHDFTKGEKGVLGAGAVASAAAGAGANEALDDDGKKKKKKKPDYLDD